MIMGTAGTGKSYVIKAIRQMLRSMSGNQVERSFLVMAPTVVAVYNINGTTIHSTLSIPIFNSNNFEINNNNLKQLQNRLEKIIYLIIDEKSMIGQRMLGLMDIRLRQAFPNQSNEPFGGRSIIIFGDFG